MSFLRVAAAFLFVASMSTVLTLTLSALGSRFWPVAILLLIVGACVAALKPLEKQAPVLLVGYGSAFALTLMLSLPESVAPRSVMLRSLAYGVLGVVILASILIVLAQAVQKRSSGLGWVVAALSLGVLVAFVSGDKGGAGPMREFLRQYFSDLVAEVVLWIARKAIHVGFYGLLALLFYRASRSAGLASPGPAIWFSLAHGGFDEYRQHFSSARMGTPVDLLFDAAGVLLFLRWAGAFRKPQTSS